MGLFKDKRKAGFIADVVFDFENSKERVLKEVVELCEKFPKINFIASGGVSSLDDVKNLREMNVHGAIIGKAYYTGAIDLAEAVKVAR